MIANRSSQGSVPLLLLGLVIFSAIIALIVSRPMQLLPMPAPLPKFNSHAVERHASEATIARQCVGKGTLFHNPETNRFANVCETERGFGVWIWEHQGDRAQEVTAFLKNKMKRFDQIQRYMENAGYKIVH